MLNQGHGLIIPAGVIFRQPAHQGRPDQIVAHAGHKSPAALGMDAGGEIVVAFVQVFIARCLRQDLGFAGLFEEIHAQEG